MKNPNSKAEPGVSGNVFFYFFQICWSSFVFLSNLTNVIQCKKQNYALYIIQILNLRNRPQMSKSRLDQWQQFIESQAYRQTEKLSPKLQALLDYCEYLIHTQFDKNTKIKYQFKKRKINISQEHRQALKTLNRDEKLQYYCTFVKIIKIILEGKPKDQFYPPLLPKQTMISDDVLGRSYNLRIWKEKKLRLDRAKNILYAERQDKIKTYDLSDYILRSSKNTDYHTFVLEAINTNPHIKSRTVHFGFKEKTKLAFWFNEIKAIYKKLYWNFVSSQLKDQVKKLYRSNVQEVRVVESEFRPISSNENMLSKSVVGEKSFQMKAQNASELQHKQHSNTPFNSLETVKNKQEFQEDKIYHTKQEEIEQPRQRRKTLIETLANIHADDQEQIQKAQQTHKSFEVSKDIFSKIWPQYNLQHFEKTMNYGNLYTEDNLKVFGHLEKHTNIKMFLNLPNDTSDQQIMEIISMPQFMKMCNENIEEAQIKTLIKSQNSALIYEKIKPYNKLYRARDFLFLRHIFKRNQTLYMVDKSLQNINYPPFMTIVRGELCILWGIKEQQKNKVLIADIQISNQGYLNATQDLNLTMKLVKGWINLQKVIKANKGVLGQVSVFDNNWDVSHEMKEIKEYKQPEERQSSEKIPPELMFKKKKTVQEVNIKQEKKQAEQNFFSIPNNETNDDIILETTKQSPFKTHLEQKIENEKGQIDENQSKEAIVSEIQRKLDDKGYVIISNSFAHTKYIQRPLQEQPIVYAQSVKGHPIWKGQWKHDKEDGGIIFINEKKIQDQKGVLKFIIAKIGKNILERKSILQISLPVDIFSPESNLERLFYSLTYAPVILDPAAKEKQLLARFKKIVAFGISNSPLYLNMEKPFNPILGQTFQCWINGCPGYAEQISHHPPIAALWYEGHQYRITAQLESKVELHMNSGCGTNDGIFRITFKDGVEACYITPGGQVSGLTYGDRKFNMVGKSYFWVEKELMFVEIVCDPFKKSFFSVGKQTKPSDYFQGQILIVQPNFMNNFLSGKRKGPSQKEIKQKLGKISGIWHKQVYFNEQLLIDIDTQFPAKLEYEANPLPSDANWRQDIQYRRLNQISKAQSEKERLEVLQRKDRKFRQNYKKKNK